MLAQLRCLRVSSRPPFSLSPSTRFPNCTSGGFFGRQTDCQRTLCNVGIELFRTAPVNTSRKALRECLLYFLVVDATKQPNHRRLTGVSDGIQEGIAPCTFSPIIFLRHAPRSYSCIEESPTMNVAMAKKKRQSIFCPLAVLPFDNRHHHDEG